MRTIHCTVLSMALFAGLSTRAQFDLSQVEFWVGSGPDSSVLVVDFQDGSDDPSYAWGYLHNGATGEAMLTAIAEADVNLDVEFASGSLNSMSYGGHAGIGGAPDYWSTWSGTNIATMNSNLGVSGVLANGDWLGCSYTDFDPALPPREPIPALDPNQFTADDVLFWVGAGQDTALLVIDFLDGTETSSYAWGYLFDGAATAEMMLLDIATADDQLLPVISSGFLSDIAYADHEGIGGSPFYWSTWSAINLGSWTMNLGLSTTLSNGALFGCSYTDFPPPIAPGYPVAAPFPTGIQDRITSSIHFFPQPATDLLYVRAETTTPLSLTIHSISGERVMQATLSKGTTTLDVRRLSAGNYVLRFGGSARLIVVD
ncbi:MAG TPA: T9SS type A sorting domain-containing protein [Flavobacteriales bacterium]|jgi:DUF971 family protein|nr:T9SS type A sorting domain-containing protein [Flavobacteriales bacterium]MBK7103458.1 T9SS type A sorting domain-containing protein [Flavobacteriales bacterium]MBK7114056.1 T9SS type A sorting domain-containing protein [Flavobacteriales bacterium]MBK7619971.1 T9SS type A sorting domain-containing protein [Flavobacteriales bacterium]MBK8531893.1 T9SS type A sorting domain-containing protein [Flavobacteriales bacterium]